MEFSRHTKQVRVMQGGATVLRAQANWISAPETGHERFNECYQGAAMAYLSWAQNKQGRVLQEEYAAQKPDRMFGFRPMICNLEITDVWQEGRFLSVVIDSVKNSGIRGEYPICHRSADVWDMQRGVIMPLKLFLTHVPELRGLRVQGKRPEGLWLDRDGVVLYHNGSATGYAENRTGIRVNFVPRRGGVAQDLIPVLAPDASRV